MKQLLIIIALAIVTTASAQSTAVKLQQGKYINKAWKYSAPKVTDIPVLFDYPCVTVGDSTYRVISNVGDTSTATYDLYISNCVNDKNVAGIMSISVYKNGEYYLSLSYGNLIRRYTLKYNNYEMGNH
jgi:signal peptidase I